MLNQNRVTLVAGGIGFVLAFLFVQYRMLTKGLDLTSMMIYMAVLLPFIAMAALATRQAWIGTLLGLLTINAAVPLPVLSRITPGLFFVVVIIGLELVRGFTVSRQSSLFHSTGSRCMMLVAAGITARILWDRPGSTNLGQTGGAGQAILYLAGGFGYLAVSRVAADSWDTARNCRIMAFLAAVGTVITVAISAVDVGVRGAITSIFSLPVWLIGSLTLARVHNRWSRGGVMAWMRYLLVVFLILGLSVITPFRSRPYFALAMIFMTGWGYHQLRKAGLALVLGGSLIACVMMWGGPGDMSMLTTRALSTLRSVNQRDAFHVADTYGISNEFGWQSDFRMTLAQLAFDNIKRHPILGKGFGFSAEDLANAASLTQVGALGAGDMTLVVGGSYHNTMLALSVFCGVPLAAIFVLGFALTVRRYIRLVRDKQDAPDKVFGVALLAFTVVLTGQALMNGDGTMFLIICCCLGVMNGMISAEDRRLAGQGKEAGVVMPA